jgi:hypothetical protein
VVKEENMDVVVPGQMTPDWLTGKNVSLALKSFSVRLRKKVSRNVDAIKRSQSRGNLQWLALSQLFDNIHNGILFGKPVVTNCGEINGCFKPQSSKGRTFKISDIRIQSRGVAKLRNHIYIMPRGLSGVMSLKSTIPRIPKKHIQRAKPSRRPNSNDGR